MRQPLHDIREAAHIEGPCVAFAVSRGWMEKKIGDDGWPDRLFIRLGLHVWHEFKVPGGPLTPKQIVRIPQLRAAGAKVYITDSVERFKRLMR